MLSDMISFLSDLASRRGQVTVGHNAPSLMVALNRHTKSVEILPFEPDPITFRDEYYYNSVDNVLYKKISNNTDKANISAYWKRASYE